MIVLLLPAALLCGTACSRKTVTEQQAIRFAQATMQDVLPAMIKTLREKVEHDGAGAAVGFCRDFVPGFGKEKMALWSEKARSEMGASGFAFRRISLRNRNAKNVPDEAQAEVLALWQQQGARPTFYERAGKYYTMHPIQVSQPLCLACHGAARDLDPGAVRELHKLYPDDKATGYKLGDLRGAFVTEISFAP